MNLKTVTIADLEPHPDNPNTHPTKQIDALGDSLDEFDQVKNVVIWNNRIIAGHGVIKAAIKSGRLTLEAVDVSDWTEDKATAFMLADIRLPDMAFFDEAAMVEALREVDEPLGIPGVDQEFLAGLDGWEVKEPPKDTTPIELGAVEKAQEIWQVKPVEGDDTTETACKGVLLSLILFPDAIHFWWGGNYYTNVLPPSPCWLIWDKDNTGNFADCEMAWSNQSTAARIFEHRWNGMIKASEQGQRRIHPTQKPVALFEWAANKYFKEGGIVFDPFLGSGISIIGAESIGDTITVIGCEIVPEYIAVICQRFLDHTDITPELTK